MRFARASLLLLLFAAAPVFAQSLRTNFYASFGGGDLSLLNNTSAMLNAGSFGVGIFGAYDSLHSYVADQSYGLAIKYGEDTFVEFGAGSFKRRFVDTTGSGQAAYLLFGKVFGSNLNVSLQVGAKRIAEGLDPRWIYDIYPTIGWSFGK